jgi:WXG100 family type VII secretion target
MVLATALFRASHDELPKISKAFGSEATRVKSSIDRLNRVIQVLEGGDWIGEGANAFFNEMRSEVMPAMLRLVKALEMGADATRKTGQVIDQLEQDATQLFSVILVAFEVGGAVGGVAVGEMGGIGGQAAAAASSAGGSGGGSSSATGEQAAGGGGGGGGGGSGGGGSGGGGGGSWDGEIGFKQEKPAPGAPPARPRRR